MVNFWNFNYKDLLKEQLERYRALRDKKGKRVDFYRTEVKHMKKILKGLK